jgi:hypothetical protein
MTITRPLKDALDLAHRFQESELFQRYVAQRMRLVVPAAVLMLATSLLLAFGTVAYVGGTRSFTVLLSLLLAPFVLVGSLLVQGYMFLAWLEGRAIAHSLGHRTKKQRGKIAAWIESRLHAALGDAPPVPWLLAGIFVALPFVALALSAPKLAIAVAAAQIVAPIAFARLDRG